MLVGCIAILAIMLLMIFVFIRAKKKNYAMVCFALLILPFFHALGEIFGNELATSMDISYILLLDIVDFGALIFSCVAILFVSKSLNKSKMQRVIALVTTISYSVVLAITLMVNS